MSDNKKEGKRVWDSSQYFQMVSPEEQAKYEWKKKIWNLYKVGDTIHLGNYPQFEDGDSFAINWMIIKNHPWMDAGKAILISNRCLFPSLYVEYQEVSHAGSSVGIKWENSLLRSKLNHEFYEAAFTEEERTLLCPKTAGFLSTLPGIGVQDKVFLLSEQEVKELLPSQEERKAKATGYAKKCGVMESEGFAPWWILPFDDTFDIYPQAVYPDGEIRYHSRNIYHGDFGVRPCIMIDLEAYYKYHTKKLERRVMRDLEEKKKTNPQYHGPRYYKIKVENGFIFKVMGEDCYKLDLEKGKWVYDSSLSADWGWGENIGYEDVVLDDSYEIEASPEEELMYLISIGRQSDCQICLKDKTVSRIHATLWYLGNHKWYLFDMVSTNGTFLNGEKVRSGYFTTSDELRIGESKITYSKDCFTIETNGNYEFKFLPKDGILKQGLKKRKKSYYLGCLLGGAVGDALGYPVEFQSERIIFNIYGKEGIQHLGQDGTVSWISDDTQMTLFAANGILYKESNPTAYNNSSWDAYREWLGTQGDTRCMEPGKKPKMWIYEDKRLHALRAPGNTCLNALRNTVGKLNIEYADNNSKGCGTVMRAAPFGLRENYNSVKTFGEAGKLVYLGAKYDAMLTHGHPYAAASSVILADMIYQLVQRNPQRNCLLQEIIFSSIQGEPAFVDLLTKSIELAMDYTVSDLDGIHALGEGWVAEEALAIALFCAVRYQNDFAKAIRTAVNHKGDSDSTGAICGNILGAWLGKEAVEQAFDLTKLELVDVITEIAEDMYRAVEDGVPEKGQDPEWDRKYRDR